jgi:hypothetical protein
MRAFVRVVAVAAGVCLGIIFVGSTPTLAEQVVVLSGQTGRLAPGSVVDKATEISLEAGQTLVINDEKGETRTLVGPYRGPIGGIAANGKSKSLAGNFARLLDAPKSEHSRLGASRDVLMSAPAGDTRKSAEEVMLIDVSQPGKLCVNANGQPWLWRSDVLDTNSRLTITNIAQNQTAVVFWQGGEPYVQWPYKLPVIDGEKYLLDLDFAPRAVEVTLLRAPANLKGLAELAAWMQSVGCDRQAILTSQIPGK